MKTIEELLEYYEIESVDEFQPEFYTMNLVNSYSINSKAVDNLLSMYSKEDLIKIENYDEIGIVEYVADNRFYIKDNRIIGYNYDDEFDEDEN